MTPEGNFMVIWMWNGLEGVKLFLWKAMNRSLLTNSERVRRHMSSCDLCLIFGGDEESLLYIFENCNRIRNLWNYLRIPNPREVYTNSNWCVWLETNLCRDKQIEIKTRILPLERSSIVFGMLATMLCSTTKEPISDLFFIVLSICQKPSAITKLCFAT